MWDFAAETQIGWRRARTQSNRLEFPIMMGEMEPLIPGAWAFLYNERRDVNIV